MEYQDGSFRVQHSDLWYAWQATNAHSILWSEIWACLQIERADQRQFRKAKTSMVLKLLSLILHFFNLPFHFIIKKTTKARNSKRLTERKRGRRSVWRGFEAPSTKQHVSSRIDSSISFVSCGYMIVTFLNAMRKSSGPQNSFHLELFGLTCII